MLFFSVQKRHVILILLFKIISFAVKDLLFIASNVVMVSVCVQNYVCE